QLPQEDVLVRIDRMHHEVEELRHIRLEGMALWRLRVGGHSAADLIRILPSFPIFGAEMAGAPANFKTAGRLCAKATSQRRTRSENAVERLRRARRAGRLGLIPAVSEFEMDQAAFRAGTGIGGAPAGAGWRPWAEELKASALLSGPLIVTS